MTATPPMTAAMLTAIVAPAAVLELVVLPPAALEPAAEVLAAGVAVPVTEAVVEGTKLLTAVEGSMAEE